MTALVWAVIGIGLSAALLFGGISYFQNVGPSRSQTKETVIAAFQALASAYRAYISANNIAPTTGAWQTQLMPTYISELKYPISGMTWSYGADGAAQCSGASCGNYFCLSGSVSQAVYKGFNDASGSFNANAYIIDTSACAARTNAGAPASWPANIYVTYWLQGA